MKSKPGGKSQRKRRAWQDAKAKKAHRNQAGDAPIYRKPKPNQDSPPARGGDDDE